MGLTSKSIGLWKHELQNAHVEYIWLHFFTNLIRGSPGGPYTITYGTRSPTSGSDRGSTANDSLKNENKICLLYQ